MNERWRVALAGLVAALAIPFLIFDSPAPAGGVESGNQETQDVVVAPAEEVELASAEVVVPTNAVEIVVTTTEISPDISRLADQAGTWGIARAQAVQDGRVAATFTPPPSETNYSLLPVVNLEPAPVAEEPTTDEPEVDEELPGEEPTDPLGEEEVVEPGDPDVEAPENSEGEPGPDPVEEEVSPVEQLVPVQVDGRVPPPAGGPTAAQWNALRKCESTHNYAAISPSGLYRGAYQFSQQTWDWVSGIHYPELVGVDPIDAAPAWQDVMAYTLYAMRGWDQWPICGKYLL